MELGRTHVIDVSDSTIRALKIIALIAFVILCSQIIKIVLVRAPVEKRDQGQWGGQRSSSNKNTASETEKRYWKKVAENIDKEYPSSGSESSSKRPSDGKKSKMKDVVADKNIQIKKKPAPIAPVVRKSPEAKVASDKKKGEKKDPKKKNRSDDGANGDKKEGK